MIIPSPTITDLADLPALAASRALVSSATGVIDVSTVTATELGYLSGVTSGVQGQLDGKAATSHSHAASDITSGTFPVARGGTALSSYVANQVFYASSTGAMAQSSALQFNGISLTLDNHLYIAASRSIVFGDDGYIRRSTASSNILFGFGTYTTYYGTAANNPMQRHKFSLGDGFAGTEVLSLGLGTVFNETGANYDFRIESDTDPNCFTVDAGNDSVGVGVALGSHAPSAKLQVDSTTKGFLPPRMTSTQRTAISSPAEGLIVYDTTSHVPYVFNGTGWKLIYTV